MGKDLHDRGRWSDALPHLVLAASCVVPEEQKACSGAAMLAARIAFEHPTDVDRTKAPWGQGAPRLWARRLLAQRLGAASYEALVGAALAGKLGAPTDDAVARFLVDDILSHEPDSTDAIVLAARIDARYPRAHLALARKRHTQRNLPDARAAAKLAVDLSDDSTPEVTVEAAHIYFVCCTEDEVGSPGFSEVVERAQGLSKAAAALWKTEFGRLPHAFAPLYWKGRHEEALATQPGTTDEAQREHYRAALKAYVAFKDGCRAAGFSYLTPGEGDVPSRIQSCAARVR